jgi:hypothetical protein
MSRGAVVAAVVIVVGLGILSIEWIRRAPSDLSGVGKPLTGLPSDPGATSAGDPKLLPAPGRKQAAVQALDSTLVALAVDVRDASGVGQSGDLLVGIGNGAGGQVSALFQGPLPDGRAEIQLPRSVLIHNLAWILVRQGEPWQTLSVDRVEANGQSVFLLVAARPARIARIRCRDLDGLPLVGLRCIIREKSIGEPSVADWWCDRDRVLVDWGKRRVFEAVSNQLGDLEVSGLVAGEYFVGNIDGEWALSQAVVFDDQGVDVVTTWHPILHLAVHSPPGLADAGVDGAQRIEMHSMSSGFRAEIGVGWSSGDIFVVRRVGPQDHGPFVASVGAAAPSGLRASGVAESAVGRRRISVQLIAASPPEVTNRVVVRLPAGGSSWDLTWFEDVKLMTRAAIRVRAVGANRVSTPEEIEIPVHDDAASIGVTLRVEKSDVATWSVDVPITGVASPLAVDFGRLGWLRLFGMKAGSQERKEFQLFSASRRLALAVKIGPTGHVVGPLPVGRWTVIGDRIKEVDVRDGEITDFEAE